jgi:hypothetical protein
MIRAIDRRNNMSPHSPLATSKKLEEAYKSPTQKSPTQAQKLRAKAMLTSKEFQELNTSIQTIFAKALEIQPINPIAFVAEELRHAGLMKNNKLTKSPSQKLRKRVAILEQQVEQVNALPPVRPSERNNNTTKNPRRYQRNIKRSK